jgi:hypothetical protein
MCPPYAKYPKYGGQTFWDCMDCIGLPAVPSRLESLRNRLRELELELAFKGIDAEAVYKSITSKVRKEIVL